MMKLVVSTIVVAAFVLYAIFSRGDVPVQTVDTPDIVASASSTASESTGSTSSSDTTSQSDATASQQTVTSADRTTTSAAQTTTTVASGLYADGSYTGSEASLVYGVVQVAVVVDGGQIVDIEFLSLPSGRQESDEINSYAAPVLRREALEAQGAKVQAVSGATLTSRAFRQSLQSALDQAQP